VVCPSLPVAINVAARTTHRPEYRYQNWMKSLPWNMGKTNPEPIVLIAL
jgi:hypothetical protein